VGVAGRLAHDDPDPGAAVTARGELLDATVVEGGGGAPAVLDEDLGEFAAPAESGVEDPLDHVGVDQKCCS
jgi:hypothetical protein